MMKTPLVPFRLPCSPIHWIPLFVFAILAFSYFFFVVDTRLIYQQQQPVFFLGLPFFTGFPGYPGGFADYLSAMLSQFLVFPLAGSCLIAALLSVAVVASSALFSLFTRPLSIPFIAFIPSLFLIVFHSNYWYPLSISISFVFALTAACLVCTIKIKPLLSRLSLFFVMGIIVYWVAGGQLFLYGVLCVLYDVLIAKKFFAGILEAILVLAIPFTAFSTVIISTFYKAFFHQLPFYYDYRPALAPYILYAFLLLVIPLNVLFANLFGRFAVRKESGKRRTLFETAIVIVCAASCMTASFNAIQRSCLRMDFFNRNGKWDSLLQEMHSIMTNKNIEKQSQLFTNLDIYPFYVNRALFHKGVLLDSMFDFWQLYPPAGTVPPNALSEHLPVLASDIYFDLGFANASQRWAYEAYATSKTPWILKRLALTCFLANQKQDAKQCLSMLQRTLFDRDWAFRYGSLMADDSLLEKDPAIRHLRAIMPGSDFIYHGIGDGQNLDLAELFRQKSNTKMAFEFLVANHLLFCRPDSIVSLVKDFERLGYSSIPRHCEEALVFCSAAQKRQFDLGKFRIKIETIDKFRDFMRILVHFNGDMQLASKDLIGKYGDTFWYYLYAAKPAGR
jgi:hypothetical protein